MLLAIARLTSLLRVISSPPLTEYYVPRSRDFGFGSSRTKRDNLCDLSEVHIDVTDHVFGGAHNGMEEEIPMNSNLPERSQPLVWEL